MASTRLGLSAGKVTEDADVCSLQVLRVEMSVQVFRLNAREYIGGCCKLLFELLPPDRSLPPPPQADSRALARVAIIVLCKKAIFPSLSALYLVKSDSLVVCVCLPWASNTSLSQIGS